MSTGSLEFVQTNVALPGNSKLPVSVGRRLITGQDAKHGFFGNWDLEIPHLHGIFANGVGWQSRSAQVTTRCSDFGAPPDTVGGRGSGWRGNDYWHGSFLYIPGVGDQEMLRRSQTNTIAPTGANSYPVITRNNWQFRCLPSMASGSGIAGEAFLAISPDGTEYQFDWGITRAASTLTRSGEAPDAASTSSDPPPSSGMRGPSESTTSVRLGNESETPQLNYVSMLGRHEIWILPTRITDRFGNSVTYTYDSAGKSQLQSIVANDGAGTTRKISFTYVVPGSSTVMLVSTVTDGTRTWSYQYNGSDYRSQLRSVTLPDNSTWQVWDLISLTSSIQYSEGGAVTPRAKWYPVY